MEWVQRQDSVDRIQLMHLKRLRDMAVEKKMSSAEAENSKEFLFPIAMIFNVDCAMYVTIDNFHISFCICGQILLKI